MRRLFSLAAAVSLLLCLATATLWVVSCYRGDGRGTGGHGFWMTIFNIRGHLELSWMRGTVAGDPYSSAYSRGPVDTTPLVKSLTRRAQLFRGTASSYRFVDFEFHTLRARDRKGNDGISRIVVIPHWFLVVAFAALPTAWLISRARRDPRAKREALGQCVYCGYDLRATPDKCPECGTVPETKRPQPQSVGDQETAGAEMQTAER